MSAIASVVRHHHGAAIGGRRGLRPLHPPYACWEHTIRCQEDLRRHIDTIHFNPVKHGYVTHPDDWPYSTWHRYQTQHGPVMDLDAGEWW